ncbi:MAG: hypothetical protein AAB443_04070 [Patescibacteria group bacterium]
MLFLGLLGFLMTNVFLSSYVIKVLNLIYLTYDTLILLCVFRISLDVFKIVNTHSKLLFPLLLLILSTFFQSMADLTFFVGIMSGNYFNGSYTDLLFLSFVFFLNAFLLNVLNHFSPNSFGGISYKSGSGYLIQFPYIRQFSLNLISKMANLKIGAIPLKRFIFFLGLLLIFGNQYV